MTPQDSREDWIVRQARERPPARRADFLDGACAGDVALRQRVEALLAAQTEGGGIAGPTVTDPNAQGLRTEPFGEEVPGTLIGHYKLLERLGEGGFGAVWLAEQKEPVRRKVALKIIKLGMDTKQVVARFEAERQALAMMDHPNIAKVLDAGATDTGRLYFVMELVRGIRITDYCDQANLSTKERLDLFIKVCQAIQHAHQKGIIHRDIKPSNVMVTLHDGVPVPKVIDFGIAKATQGELTDKTIHTQFQQFIGTPAYMSPEQAEMSGLDIDTRSDIYSLGVLLYELLAGSTPFDAKELMSQGIDAMRKTIREKEPMRPSTKLALLKGEELTTTAKRRSVETSKLANLLRGDLDWIVMKCLEKDRTRRYETANAVAMDIRRHLSCEPVLACPPSRLYEFQKTVRRHKFGFAAGATVMFALTAGVVGTSLGLFRAEQERANAERAAQAEAKAADDARQARASAESNAATLETNLYFSQIAWAHREITAQPANVGEAQRLLTNCPPHLRNWEWYYLKRRRFVEPLVINDPGSRVVHSVAFSPDDRHLASGGSDGTVKIWDLAGPRLVRVLTNHGGLVASVAFCPTNSALIASAGADHTLRLWDWNAAREIHSWPCDAWRDFGMAYAVAFSPDGQCLASPGTNGEVRVRYTETGGDALTLPGHGAGAYCVAFSGDGRWIATGSAHGTVRVWEATTGRPYAEVVSNAPPAGAVAFTKDSRCLVAMQFDGSVRVWDTISRKERCRYSVRISGSPMVGLTVHPNGVRMFTGGMDRLITLSNPIDGRQVLVLRELANGCYALALSPDGHRLAAASRGGKLYVWDARPLVGTEDPSLNSLFYPGGEVWALDVAPNGRSFAVGGFAAGTPPRPGAPIHIWRGADDRAPRRLAGHAIIVFGLAYDPTGRFLASCGDEPTRPGIAKVRVWDLQTEEEAFPVEAFEGNEREFAVAYHPSGRWLVAAGIDRKIKVWDAASGRNVGVVGAHANEVTVLVFSPKGRYLASMGNDDVVKVWDGSRLDQPQSNPRQFPGLCSGPTDLLAFSPEENRLAIATDDDTAVLHDLSGDDRKVRLYLPGHRPLALAFSPDGRWVASGGGDCTVRIWDSRLGTLRHTLRSHTGLIDRLRFAPVPAGLRLISGSRDGTVKFWDVEFLEKEPTSQ